MNAVSMTESSMSGTAHEAWWLPAHVAYRYVGVHPTLGEARFATLLAAQVWAGIVAAEPAVVSVHESFTKDFGTLASEAHARGEHTYRASLVCPSCRAQAGH